MRIVWLPRAGRSLDEAFEFLEALNPVDAVNVYNDILDSVEILATGPFVAAVEALLCEEPEMFRSLVVRQRYKVVYFVEEEMVKIADVWDCRQNPETLKTRPQRR